MIKGNAQWFQTYRGQFSQEHPIFAQDTRINSLIEIYTAPDARSAAYQLSTWRKAKVPNLRDDFLEPRGSDNIIVHQS
jgi:hypothetical protein